MEFILTNKCKDYIMQAENGLKLQIKGFALLIDKEQILNSKDSKDPKDLNLIDFYRSNPTLDSEIIVTDPRKSGKDILDNLFDMTYVPSVELMTTTTTEDEEEIKTDNYYPFGTYNITIDKSLYPFAKYGLIGTFDAVLVIGQVYKEYSGYLKEVNKSFLAAIITNENGFVLDDNTKSYNITWNFTIADSESLDLQLTENYTTFSADHSMQMKDNQTTQIDSLFIVPADNLDYDNEINIIGKETHDYLEDPTEYVPLIGTYDNKNIILADDTEKINNYWNVDANVCIFDRHDLPVVKPQIMLSYASANELETTGESGEYITDSIAITYSNRNNVFSINQTNGNDKVQVNLFPENIVEENKFCVDPSIKPFNYTTISAWSAQSDNSRFFKYNSNGGHYLNDTFNTFEFNSLNNDLDESNDNTFIKSNNNELSANNNTLMLDSDYNRFYDVNSATLINSHNNTIRTHYDENQINDITMIGTNKFNTDLNESDVFAYNIENVALIGTNEYSKAINSCKPDKKVLTLTNRNNITGKFEATASNGSTATVKVSYTTDISSRNSPELDIGYNTSIGYKGLLLTNNVYEQAFSGNFVKPSDYTVLFGNYNAYTNPYTIKNTSYSSMTAYFKECKGIVYKSASSGLTADGTVINIEDKPVNVLHFENHQDNFYCSESNSASFNSISSDEGDYSLNKLVVFGGGDSYTDTSWQDGFTPAENVVKSNSYSDFVKRIDLFSIEKDSYQLTHNNSYDDNPSCSATNVTYIPSMFAVRGWEKPVQKYSYRYTSAWNSDNTNIITKKELYKNINNYNLQNAVYTPDTIYVPLNRSSNDVYHIDLKQIYDYVNDDYIAGIPRNLNNTELNTQINNLETKNVTYVVKTDGIKIGKEVKYVLNISDILTILQNKGITIGNNGAYGTDTKNYTIYLINTNAEKELLFNAIRLYKYGGTLQAVRTIKPGQCQKIVYKNNGYNGEYGIMNFDYYRE